MVKEKLKKSDFPTLAELVKRGEAKDSLHVCPNPACGAQLKITKSCIFCLNCGYGECF